MPQKEPPSIHFPRQYIVWYFQAPDYRTETWHKPRAHWSQFSVVLSGEYTASWNEQGRSHRLTAQAGDVLFLSRGHARWEANAESPRMTAYALAVDWDLPRTGLAPLAHDRRGLIRVLAGELLALYVGDLPAATKQELMNAFFLALVAEYRRLTAVHRPAMAEELRVFTEEHLEERFSIADLARHFGLGVRQFGHRYRAETGRTPMDEVGWLGAEQARALILNLPALPLKEVARRIGLQDHRQLGRLFRRHFGVPARDLPRLHREPWRRWAAPAKRAPPGAIP